MSESSGSDLALQSDDIRKTFGSFTALAGITIQVRRGEFVALFGRNGAGKTTFLKVAATLMRATRGKLFINGTTVVTNAIAQLRGSRVGVLVTTGFRDTFRFAGGPRLTVRTRLTCTNARNRRQTHLPVT